MTDLSFTPSALVTTSPVAAVNVLAGDYLELDWLFTPDELALRDRVRALSMSKSARASGSGTKPQRSRVSW